MATKLGIGSLIGGAAIGAALMYLMDPEEGEARRKNLQGTVSDGMAKAGTSLGAASATAASTLHDATATATESAGSLWASLSNKASELAQSISKHAHHASSATVDSASDFAGSARGAVSSFGQRAKSAAADAYDSAKTRTGFEPEHVSYVAPLAISGTTATLVGLAAVYFLDKNRGAARRAQAYAVGCDVVNGTRDLARNVGSRIAGRERPPMEYAFSEDYVSMPATAESGDAEMQTSPKAL